MGENTRVTTTALLRETFCGGDSGSGVFVWHDSRWELLGLVSGGAGGRCAGQTRVVRLGPLAAWIEATAGAVP